MKNFNLIFLLIFIFFTSFLLGCEDDEETWRNNPPKVAFSITPADFAKIDLDKSVGPKITGTVQSDAGLQQVVIEVIRSSGTEALQTISTFDEVTSKILVVDVLPEYYEETTGFKITATDVQGRSVEETIELSAVGGFEGPMITLPPDTVRANVRIDDFPAIEGLAESHWGVTSLSFFITKNGQNVQVGQAITNFEDPLIADFSVVPDYDLDVTEFIVVALDNRGNESSDTIPVKVIDADPPPTIVVDQESVSADLKASPSVVPEISGIISSTVGLTSVSYYLVFGSTEEQFGETITTFDNNLEYSFNVIPDYAFGVSQISISATDINGQESTYTIDASVIAEDTELQLWDNVTLHAQGDRKSGVPTAFSSRDGKTYDVFAPVGDVEISESIDFIIGDSSGDDKYDIFSVTDNWLNNNYFKNETAGDIVWPVMNETRLRIVSSEEIDFATATSADIRSLNIEGGEGSTTREDPVIVGDVVMFLTSEGKKGLIYLEGSNMDAGKNDIFTIDVKVVK